MVVIIMNIRGRDVNIWKWAVFAFAAHKAARLGRALLRARRLAKKKVRWEIANRYADL